MATSLRRVSNVTQRTAVDPRPWCAVVVSIIDFIDSVVLDGDSAFIRILFSLWYVKYRVFVGGLVLRTYICKKTNVWECLNGWENPLLCAHIVNRKSFFQYVQSTLCLASNTKKSAVTVINPLNQWKNQYLLLGVLLLGLILQLLPSTSLSIL